MPYTAEEIGARVKQRKPEFAEFSDKELGERILARNPGLAQADVAAPKVPMATAHGAPTAQVPLEASHEPTAVPPPAPTAMSVPPTDPLTGRRQMPGRTMSSEETAKWRTAAGVLTGAMTGGVLGGASAAKATLGLASVGYPLTRTGAFVLSLAGRTIGAQLGGSAGEAYGQMFEWAHGIVPGSSEDAAKRIFESGKEMAKYEALGKAVEVGGAGVAAGVKAGGGKILAGLKNTSVYRGMVEAKAAAITERNLVVTNALGENAKEVANMFSPEPVAGLLSIQSKGVVRAAEEIVEKNVNIMYEGFKEAIKNKLVDYRDVADMIVKLEEKTPRARGGLKTMTEPESAWRTFVDDMKAGNVRAESEQLVAGKKMKVLSPAKNAIEAAPAVVDARGTISQRIADLKRKGNAPKEYIEGLENSLKRLDKKLEAVAEEIGPGGAELWNAPKQYFGASREVQKQALYKVMKEGGDVAKALMDPSAPEGIAVLKALARETKTPELVPQAQRAVIEKLLNPDGKGVDLIRFNDRLNALGVTGEHLFSDPRASKLLSGIRDQVAALNQLEKVPRLDGSKAGHVAAEVMTRAIASVVGYKAGKELGGGAQAGWIGAGVGVSMSNKGVGYLLRLAENPTANRMFLKALGGVERTGEITGPVVTQAARALKMVDRLESIGDQANKKEPPPPLPVLATP